MLVVFCHYEIAVRDGDGAGDRAHPSIVPLGVEGVGVGG